MLLRRSLVCREGGVVLQSLMEFTSPVRRLIRSVGGRHEGHLQTFAQLWQTPVLTGKIGLGIKGEHLSVSTVCTAASWS
jgi:hypothetical protein